MLHSNWQSRMPVNIPLPADPVFKPYEGGSRRAVLLSPILPYWDEGQYFGPLIALLRQADYSVTVFDSLSLPGDTMEELALGWSGYLAARGDRIDVFGGAALGGSIAQLLLGTAIVNEMTDVILISSPTVADTELNEKLQELANLARDHGAAASLDRLAELVAASGAAGEASNVAVSGTADPSDMDSARGRLARGFGLLVGIDASVSVQFFHGRLIHVYGRDSRLVRSENITVGGSSRHRLVEIAHCGMRPLSDHPARSLQEIRHHLGIEAEPAS